MLVVLKIHEGRVDDVVTVVVVLVGADREVGNQALRQAATLVLFLRSDGVADVVRDADDDVIVLAVSRPRYGVFRGRLDE